MVDGAKTASAGTAAPKKAAASKTDSVHDVLKVKNKSDKIINTSKGTIPPGEKGQATRAECHTYSAYLDIVK